MAKENTEERQPLRKHAMGMIGLLSLQYVLGMYTALFVKFPDTGTEEQMWTFAKTQIPVILHLLVGLMLAFGTSALFIRAIKLHDNSWKVFSGIAAVSVILAIVFGSLFVPSQSDLYSFLMAIAFMVALLSYAYGLYATK